MSYNVILGPIMVVCSKLLVGDEWISSTHGEKIFVTNPYDLKVIGQIPSLLPEQISAAVVYAHDALKAWGNTTIDKKVELLTDFHDAILSQRSSLASLITLESGKPIKESAKEIDRSCEIIKWYCSCIKCFGFSTVNWQGEYGYSSITYKPIGVCVLITPWNFPAVMIVKKLIPALAAGCTVVIKPDSRTPLTAIKLVEIASSVGINGGVINLVMAPVNRVEEILISDERVRLLSFTGSTAIGKKLMKKCSNTMKKIVLELGGNAPFVVSVNAEIKKVINDILICKFRNNGQTCISPNRFFVHNRVLNSLVDTLKISIARLKLGNGMDVDTDLGPMIDADAVARYNAFIDEASVSRATIITIPLSKQLPFNSGCFVDPVIIISKNCVSLSCFQQEIFGPIIAIQPFSDLAQAIRDANNTESALAAYLYTQDYQEASYYAKKLEFGMVGINDCCFSDPRIPFGGIKQAGIGREGGIQGLMEFLEPRYLSFKY